MGHVDVFLPDPRLGSLRVAALQNPARLLRVNLRSLAHELEQSELALALGFAHRAVEFARGPALVLAPALHPARQRVFEHTALARCCPPRVATPKHRAELFDQLRRDG